MVPSWWPTVSSGRPGDVTLERGRLVDRFLQHPFDGARDDVGRNEDQDGNEDLGPPVHQLALPIGALIDLVHELAPSCPSRV